VTLGILVATCKVIYSGTKKPAAGAGFGARAKYTLLVLANAASTVYTTVIRGTPLMLQLMIIYFLSFMPSGIIACFIGFGLNSGAYVSETFRSGIQSVDSGQMEAARSLGLSRWQAMRSVVLPQAIKNVLPAIFNEFITLVKETSVAGYIAVNELTKVSNIIRSKTYDSMAFYIAAGIYLFMTYLLTLALRSLERRFGKSDRH
jgi:polar amino acid transport system permease protein